MRFQALTRVIGRTDAGQLVLAAAGLRPAVRILAVDDRIGATVKAIEAVGLQVAIGFDGVRSCPVAGRSGYSEWAERGPLRGSDRERARYLYAGRERKHLERLRRADELTDDEATGAMLGYPSCCVRQFASLRAAAGIAPSDPVLQCYRDDGPIPWQLNVSLLCYDAALILYVPCREHCPAALAQADEFFRYLHTRHPGVARRLRWDLTATVIHSDECGITAFSGVEAPDRSGITITAIHHCVSDSVVGALARVGEQVVRTRRYLKIGFVEFPRTAARLFRFE
jgi:hypothetical protein